ncbi:hypothetical protein BDV95DRAFT_507973 [Massariosphaeria phaeospora]|uniref:SCP domain-containing protein n=1 Tax=Massariosphaeria phaeospora TaxID=100035 RepID=A0A7C8I0Y2_9PLEO|nr:hypothetical protein BDV95DRAFT_507973 [Massariosphaeria phaeospora]
MGLSPLKNSDLLSKHALGVVTKNNGQMIHEIVNLQQNPSVKSTGQVLAPGKAPGDEGEENFKKVFVGGWLCELSSLPGLEGECATMSDGWSYVDPATGKAQTGHAEILSSKDFTHIGCGWFNGQWCCDLGVIEEGSEGY